ncbi:MAG: KR domain-containing protein, partial [Cyanobacteria bacterium J06621_3]
WAGLLWKELQVDEPSAVVAYRHRHRWQQTYQATYLADSQPSRQSVAIAKGIRLRQGGLYVIVGTEGLGEIWAEQLKEHYQANVVCIEDTDTAAIETAIMQAIAQFGELRGVFVCSPMTNEKSAAPIALIGTEQWQYNCEAKKVVLENLAIALQSHTPDFCCVQSSLSSIIGGLGLAAYSGANHFIDAFVAQQNQITSFPWFSINWDAHTETEPEKNNKSNAHTSSQPGWGNALANFALTPTEVWQATERILTQAVPGQTIVSKGDLSARHKKWIQPTPHQATSSQTVDQAENQPGASYSRPQLSIAYVAPRTEVEETISAIWQDLLGLEKVGVNDSFFDLGGHSLLAIQVISRLREAFPVAIEMRNLLFEAPTVAKIASVIAEQLPQESELDDMAALLAEVQTLSAEQVQEQLAGGNAS